MIDINQFILAANDDNGMKVIGGLIFFIISAISAAMSAIAKKKEEERRRRVQEQIDLGRPIPTSPPPPLPPVMIPRQQAPQPRPAPATMKPRPQPPRPVVTPKTKRSIPQPQQRQRPAPKLPVEAKVSVVESTLSAMKPAPAIATPRRPVSANASVLRNWLRPATLNQQFILTEILQPPVAMRADHLDRI